MRKQPRPKQRHYPKRLMFHTWNLTTWTNDWLDFVESPTPRECPECYALTTEIEKDDYLCLNCRTQQ